MKRFSLTIAFLLIVCFAAQSQKVNFEEYDLPNGLHVILHQDNSAPVVATSVMYHVGGKDRTEGRTGFAHFFEHLLFEGTQNIGKGEWMKIVAANGGSNNANTSQDRTYYYEIFPSNNLELALWMESERMMHPVIKQEGVDTQNEVVKEEKRMRMDNSPYGGILASVSESLFNVHPYKDPNIGYMKDLDAATLQEFQDYFKKYYVPNNAVLVVAGDIDKEKTKKLIEDYFGPIPGGEDVVRNYPKEQPISSEIRSEYFDSNIQIPMAITAYRTPGFGSRDAFVLNMISTYLSGGKSSVLYKKLVDDEKKALQVSAFNLEQEDYGIYLIYSLPLGNTTLETLFDDIESEIAKLRTELISEEDYQKLLNNFESSFVNSNSTMEGIANTLARDYLLYKDTNLINKELDIYKSISREEIREVASKLLKKNERAVIHYLPEQKK